MHYARQALERTGASETPMAPELAFRTVLSGIDGSPEGLEAARQALALGADGAGLLGSRGVGSATRISRAPARA